MQHEHSVRFSGKRISKLKNIKLFKLFANGILLPKLFRPTVRKKCSSDREKLEQSIQTVKGQNHFW